MAAEVDIPCRTKDGDRPTGNYVAGVKYGHRKRGSQLAGPPGRAVEEGTRGFSVVADSTAEWHDVGGGVGFVTCRVYYQQHVYSKYSVCGVQVGSCCMGELRSGACLHVVKKKW